MNDAKTEQGQAVSRRGFLRAAVRAAAGVGLAAIGAALVLKGSVVGPRDGLPNQTCTGGGICPTCGDLAGCGLPSATSVKQVRGRAGQEQTRPTGAKAPSGSGATGA